MFISKNFKKYGVQGLRDAQWLLARPRLALEWWRTWHSLPVVSWIRGAQLFLAHDFKSAAVFYKRGLDLNRSHPARDCALVDLAYCHYREQRLEVALRILSLVREGSVALRDAFVLKAKIHDILGRTDKARRVLCEGLEQFPDDIKILLSYFHFALFNQETDARLESLKERLVSAKQDILLDDERRVAIDSALAHYEICLGNELRGERLLLKALSSGRAPFEAVILYGERLLDQSRVLQAREQLNRALRLSPRNPRPLRMLAESYFFFDDFKELDFAEQLAVQANRLADWKNFQNLELLQSILQEKGDNLGAELYREMAYRLKERYIHSLKNESQGKRANASSSRLLM